MVLFPVLMVPSLLQTLLVACVNVIADLDPSAGRLDSHNLTLVSWVTGISTHSPHAVNRFRRKRWPSAARNKLLSVSISSEPPRHLFLRVPSPDKLADRFICLGQGRLVRQEHDAKVAGARVFAGDRARGGREVCFSATV